MSDYLSDEVIVDFEVTTYETYGPVSLKRIELCAAEHGETPNQYILKAIHMRMKADKDL